VSYGDDFVEALRNERMHQATSWGDRHDDKHSPNDWVAILARFVGKFGDAIENGHDPREELVEIAAVAMAAYEAYCRGEEYSRSTTHTSVSGARLPGAGGTE
jgi:hypothetical protein